MFSAPDMGSGAWGLTGILAVLPVEPAWEKGTQTKNGHPTAGGWSRARGWWKRGKTQLEKGAEGNRRRKRKSV